MESSKSNNQSVDWRGKAVDFGLSLLPNGVADKAKEVYGGLVDGNVSSLMESVQDFLKSKGIPSVENHPLFKTLKNQFPDFVDKLEAGTLSQAEFDSVMLNLMENSDGN